MQRYELESGIVLIIMCGAALLVANSPAYSSYNYIFHSDWITLFGFQFSIEYIINEGLMVLFFLSIGLELKRELLHTSTDRMILPAGAALGGVCVPALIYLWCNYNAPELIRGWAIPTATDVAFALGVLALLGSRIPKELRFLLLGIAIFDDLVAILIIGIFYTTELHLVRIVGAGIVTLVLIYLNLSRVKSLRWYMVSGLGIWLLLLHSGIHATLAGVILAFAIPVQVGKEYPLLRLENSIYLWVTFLILPLFAFTNSGVSVVSITASDMLHKTALGIILGLVLGKQIGIFTTIYVMVKLKLAKLPMAVNWFNIYGMSVLCGIGFTMSLFISSLAFGDQNSYLGIINRAAILLGSIISAIWGYTVLRLSLRGRN